METQGRRILGKIPDG